MRPLPTRARRIAFHAGKAVELATQLIYAFGADWVMRREYPGVAERTIEKDINQGHDLGRLYHRILGEMKYRDMKNALEDSYQTGRTGESSMSRSTGAERGQNSLRWRTSPSANRPSGMELKKAQINLLALEGRLPELAKGRIRAARHAAGARAAVRDVPGAAQPLLPRARARPKTSMSPMGRPPMPAFAVSGDQKTEAGSGTLPPRMKTPRHSHDHTRRRRCGGAGVPRLRVHSVAMVAVPRTAATSPRPTASATRGASTAH